MKFEWRPVVKNSGDGEVPDESPLSATPNAPSGFGAGRITALVIGALLALIGIGSLAGAGFLGWANATQRDSQGYFSTASERLHTSTYAITSDRIDLHSGAGPSDWFMNNDNVAKVRVQAKSVGDVFVGIASQADVDRYLASVAHDELTRITYRPFAATYRRSAGTTNPTMPDLEQFWVAKATGSGTQTLTWAPSQGVWAVVVMNADASSAVSANIALGIRVSFLGWIICALSIGGIIAILAGTGLIVVGAAGARSSRSVTSNQPPAAVSVDHPLHADRRRSPVHLEGHLVAPLSRWLWLVKWLLLIPHLIVLGVLWVAFGVITVVAGISIVFTGRYPRSLFDFNVGVLRWTWRVQFYGPSAYGTDIYPPFTLEPSAYPAMLDIEYPEHLSRRLVFVKSWLLAIPHLVIIAVFSAGWSWNRNSGSGVWRATQLGYPGGLIGICATIAGVMVLIRRVYPQGLFDFIVGMNRWVYRVIAYVALMTDDYPPFHFDGGATEPAPHGTPPGPGGPVFDTVGTAPDAHQAELVGTSA